MSGDYVSPHPSLRATVSGRLRRPALRLALIATVAAVGVAGCVHQSATTGVQPTVAEQSPRASARDLYELGRAYETGNGVPMDLNRAAALYEEAADRGEARASERLGLLAARGDIMVDDNRTYDRLLVATLRQSDSAALELARLQLTGGQGVPRNTEAAIATLQSLVAEQDTGAMMTLATVYAEPLFGHIDYVEAARLLTEAHQRGREDAAVALAKLYARPGTVVTNRQEAQTWADVAARRGQPEAWLVIGQLAADPTIPGFDPAMAQSALQRAIDAGVPGARFEMAELQESLGQLEPALATYRQLVSEGHAEVGYEAGRILDENYPDRRGEAYAFYESAFVAGRDAAPRRILNLLEDGVEDPDGDLGGAIAIVQAWADEQADPEIYYRLGRMFETGRGQLADRRQALDYFVLAADGGIGEGALRAARMLRNAGGDGSAVIAYYRQAASLGESGALVELARYLEDSGDVDGAVQVFSAAANAGSADAAVRLARLADDNPDAAIDQSAMTALERAAAGGDVDAMVALADLLVDTGRPEDLTRALNLYYQAADRNNTSAMRRLGDLAEDRVGGMNEQDAAVFFERAVLAGDNRAAYRLLRNAARFGDSQTDYERAIEFTTPAANAGDPEVAYWYGLVLIKEHRLEEGTEWLIKAHNAGISGALDELLILVEANPEIDGYLQERIQLAASSGQLCDAGRYSLIMADQAAHQAAGDNGASLYHEALESGWYVAADRLGHLYMAGLGSGIPDLPSAFAYFQVASDAGVPGSAARAEDVSTALSEDALSAAIALKAELDVSLPVPCSE